MISTWKDYKLGDITIIVSGATPSTKKVEYFNKGTIPWITPKDLSGYSFRYISSGERNITELGLMNSLQSCCLKELYCFHQELQ